MVANLAVPKTERRSRELNAGAAHFRGRDEQRGIEVTAHEGGQVFVEGDGLRTVIPHLRQFEQHFQHCTTVARKSTPGD